MIHLKKTYVGAILALSTCGVLFQNCAAAPPPDMSQFNQSSISATTGADFSCIFSGQVVSNGQQVQAYREAQLPAGGSCVSEVRSCSNGTLSGSYSFPACTVASPSNTASCNFYGSTIAHGASIRTYQASSVPSGSSCTFQDRTCTNGTLSAGYQYTSCVVNKRDCNFNGAVVQHGGQVQAYSAASAASCDPPETRTCNDGTLSGSYAHASCATIPPNTTTPPASCTFNGATVAHGGSITAYQYAEVESPMTCTSVAEQRVCDNGRLSGSYTQSSCSRIVTDPCYGRTTTHQRIEEGNTHCY